MGISGLEIFSTGFTGSFDLIGADGGVLASMRYRSSFGRKGKLEISGLNYEIKHTKWYSSDTIVKLHGRDIALVDASGAGSSIVKYLDGSYPDMRISSTKFGWRNFSYRVSSSGLPNLDITVGYNFWKLRYTYRTDNPEKLNDSNITPLQLALAIHAIRADIMVRQAYAASMGG
ncbi:MAG: hypothetical protein Kapaf2KO_03070 [Candidatus Kapaibacteriales bacterium]